MLPLFRRISRPFASLAGRRFHKNIISTSSSVGSRVSGLPVAVFWDLDNQPPKPISSYDAAVSLRVAACSLGHLRFSVAYATPNMSRRVSAPKNASRLDEFGASSRSSEPHICRVCGCKFFAHSKLLNHFKIHEREHAKRLNRINSATGDRYVRLKAQLNLNMNKYRKVAREVLIPTTGHSLGDELRRAGISVRIVEDRFGAAHEALMGHMLKTIDRRIAGCLVLVSSDTRFSKVIMEARLRCMKTVVVGDDGDGALKRFANSSFYWKEVVSGKAKKEASSTLLKWKDKDLLEELEWRYQPKLERKESECQESEWEDKASGDESAPDGCEDLSVNIVSKPWWKLD